jgi:hypothetical protein
MTNRFDRRSANPWIVVALQADTLFGTERAQFIVARAFCEACSL